MNIGKKLLMAIAAVMVTAIVAVTVSAICTPIVCEKDCSTKVEQCDIETVMMLDPVDWARVVTVGNAVYIDMAGDNNRIGAGDIRLTTTCCGVPNTKVTEHGDPREWNAVFDVLPQQDVFTYMDSNANTIYDVGDAIYLDVDNEDTVSVDDIRLTDSPPFDVLNGDGSVAILAGHYGLKWSRVKLVDLDFGKVLEEIGTGIIADEDAGTLQALGGYIDGDCSGTWTCPDKLYLNQPTDLPQFDRFVTIGDLRLYMPPDADVMPEGMGECMPDCGTRVRQCAKDAVYALRVNTGAEWGYVEEDVDGEFKPSGHGEAAYIDMNHDGVVSVGDVRLTYAASMAYPPNSKVRDCDYLDLDDSLDIPAAFADGVGTDLPQTVFRYADLDEVPGYSLGDPVYMDVDDDNVVSKYDVRITQSPICKYEIFAPGAWGANWSIVKQTDYDAKHDMDLIPLPDGAGGDATVNDLLGFIDSDCNLCWSCVDKLYLQQLVDEDNYDLFVTIGDVRLYIPPNATGPGPDEPCWGPCGTKVWQCDVDLVYALMGMPDVAQVRYVDRHDPAGYNGHGDILGDGVYFDMDGSGKVSAGDIRLSNICGQYDPNTKVGTDTQENGDLQTDFAVDIPNDRVLYADIDGPAGYTLGDPLYLDMTGNGLSVGDIRLTAFPVYSHADYTGNDVKAAWTRVVSNDVDLLHVLTGVIPSGVVGSGVLEEITMVFDSDCSGTWTCPDKLYLQQTKDMFVTIGDERLYIPNSTAGSGPTDPCVLYDTNGTPGIQKDEAVNAINDYLFAGTINKATAVAVVNCYLFP